MREFNEIDLCSFHSFKRDVNFLDSMQVNEEIVDLLWEHEDRNDDSAAQVERIKDYARRVQEMNLPRQFLAVTEYEGEDAVPIAWGGSELIWFRPYAPHRSVEEGWEFDWDEEPSYVVVEAIRSARAKTYSVVMREVFEHGTTVEHRPPQTQNLRTRYEAQIKVLQMFDAYDEHNTVKSYYISNRERIAYPYLPICAINDKRGFNAAASGKPVDIQTVDNNNYRSLYDYVADYIKSNSDKFVRDDAMLESLQHDSGKYLRAGDYFKNL